MTYHLSDHVEELLLSQGDTLGVALDADDVALLIVRGDADRHAHIVLDSRNYNGENCGIRCIKTVIFMTSFFMSYFSCRVIFM